MGGVNSCERSSCTFRQTQSPEDWDSKRDSWQTNVDFDLNEKDGALDEQDGDSSSEPPTRSCANDCYVRKPCQSTYKRTYRARSGPSVDPTNISPMGQDIGKKSELRSRTTLPVDAGEDDEEGSAQLRRRDSNLLVPAAAATAKSVTTFNLDKRESAAEMDSTGECTTASGSISASPALSPQPVSTEITKSEDRKRINVFTDPLNWVDTEAIFAWTVTIVNALTKEKEQLSVYNNNTVGEVKKSFIENTGCSTGMRLFHLVGMKCQELEDDWELRHCIRNRANVIAYAGDLPALLQGAGALKSDQTESEQPKAQQTVVVGKS
mmetsp:Transcript_29424/g.40849  ORF Transcript_29424/g.40849 Transcript_29424/m.40849 type:complete len:322 (-) Transcript_29424:433-1398(-)